MPMPRNTRNRQRHHAREARRYRSGHDRRGHPCDPGRYATVRATRLTANGLTALTAIHIRPSSFLAQDSDPIEDTPVLA